MSTIPIYNMADTWNAIGTTFNGIYMNFTDGAGGAPVGAAASRFFRLDSDGTSVFDIAASGDTSLASAAFLAWSTDLKLFRSAAGVLAQRDGTNAQAFHINNTYSGAGANYERLFLGWSSNEIFILSQSGGTGSARAVTVGTEGAASLLLYTNSQNRWLVNSSGHFLSGLDNTYDIGASGATRPRTVYAGTSIITPALRVDQAPTANASAATTITNGADSNTNLGHRASFNMNGTTYWFPCGSVAF